MYFELEIDGTVQEVSVERYSDIVPGFQTILVSLDDSYETYVEALVDEESAAIHIVDETGFTNPNTAEEIIRNVMEMLDYEESEEEYDSGYESELEYESEGEPLEIPEGW